MKYISRNCSKSFLKALMGTNQLLKNSPLVFIHFSRPGKQKTLVVEKEVYTTKDQGLFSLLNVGSV